MEDPDCGEGGPDPLLRSGKRKAEDKTFIPIRTFFQDDRPAMLFRHFAADGKTKSAAVSRLPGRVAADKGFEDG